MHDQQQKQNHIFIVCMSWACLSDGSLGKGWHNLVLNLTDLQYLSISRWVCSLKTDFKNNHGISVASNALKKHPEAPLLDKQWRPSLTKLFAFISRWAAARGDVRGLCFNQRPQVLYIYCSLLTVSVQVSSVNPRWACQMLYVVTWDPQVFIARGHQKHLLEESMLVWAEWKLVGRTGCEKKHTKSISKGGEKKTPDTTG